MVLKLMCLRCVCDVFAMAMALLLFQSCPQDVKCLQVQQMQNNQLGQ